MNCENIAADELVKKIKVLRDKSCHLDLTPVEQVFIKKMNAFVTYNEPISNKQIEWIEQLYEKHLTPILTTSLNELAA